ncbi:MAG: hypothetical protein WAN69_19170 [Candidatus Korobacteraceae bacterium]
MQYETCCHTKEDGAYCGSPALRDRKYCYYHLMERGRRLRRARALRENVPYRLEIPPLRDLDSVQFALSEITQALGTGLLDYRAAGRMLYAIQQATSLIKYRAKLDAAQPETTSETTNDANQHSPAGEHPRVQEYPGFEQEFGINPGTDIDAETAWTLRKADEEVELRHVNDLPAPPPGMRLGSAQYRVYRDEAYQALNVRLNSMKHQLRDYNEQKRQQFEKMRKEMMSAAPSAEPLADSA